MGTRINRLGNLYAYCRIACINLGNTGLGQSMNNDEYIHLGLFYRTIPGAFIFGACISAASVEFLPSFVRLFFLFSGILTLFILWFSFMAERDRQKEIHNEMIAEMQARRQTIENQNALMMIAVQSKPELDRTIPVTTSLPVAVNGYTKSEWEHIIERILREGHAKSVWYRYILPSGKQVSSFPIYDAMLKPLVIGGAIVGREEGVSGELIERNFDALLKMAMTPLLSQENDRLKLVIQTRPDQYQTKDQ